MKKVSSLAAIALIATLAFCLLPKRAAAQSQTSNQKQSNQPDESRNLEQIKQLSFKYRQDEFRANTVDDSLIL